VLVGELFKMFSLFEHAEIQENAISELRAITESAFQEAFQQRKKRWERCIASRGGYFEGNSA
jgi:ABC-type polar amino acid transport system ATPase subunit